MEQIFRTAMEAKGQAYLNAEQALLSGGLRADNILTSNLNNPDPVAKAIAVNLLKMKRGGAPENSDALGYIEALPASPMLRSEGGPNLCAVLTAENIFGKLNTKPAEYLALRLLKQADWHSYQAYAVTTYLEKAKDPRTTALLIRFAVETKDPNMRGDAIEVIQSIHDPKLDQKIEAECKRAQKQGWELPPVLETLRKMGK